MAFDINTYTESERYTLFKRVINRAAEVYGERDVGDDPTTVVRETGHPFREEEDAVNLLAVRGFQMDAEGSIEMVPDTVKEYNDTVFVIYRNADGVHVKGYPMGTDTQYLLQEGSKASAYLTLGQHRYRIGCHSKRKTRCRLDDIVVRHDDSEDFDRVASRGASNDWSKWEKLSGIAKGPMADRVDFNSKDYGYRALIPDRGGVLILRDYSGNRELDEDERNVRAGGGRHYGDLDTEGYERNGTINIHHAAYKHGPYSLGCQTIPGWETYKDFIRRVEQDTSIKLSDAGNANRELAATEHGSGDRPVIYTLVTAEFVEESADAQPFQVYLPFSRERFFSRNVVQAYYDNNERGAGGWYPLGANQTWHNGVHLVASQGDAVRAVAPGRIVAARLARNDQLDEYPFGSPGFVLMEHTLSGFPVDAEATGSREPSDLARVEAELSYVRDELTMEGRGDLRVGTLLKLTDEEAMTFEVGGNGTTWQRVEWMASGGGTQEGWIDADALGGASSRLPKTTTPAKIATDEDSGGLNCRARTDFGDNVIKVLPKGATVELSTERIHAKGYVWQAVRAPDQGVPFGWVVTSGGRVDAAEQKDETTSTFYSLYMNVAWEPEAQSETPVPWIEPYYGALFEDQPTDDISLAYLNRDVRMAGRTFPKHTIVERFGDLHNGAEMVSPATPTEMVFDYVPKDALTALSATGGYLEIVTNEDGGGLNCRAFPDTGYTDESELGVIPKNAWATVYDTEVQAGGWTWRPVRAPNHGIPYGWITTTHTNRDDNARPPQAGERGKELKQAMDAGDCLALDIPVDVGEPVANTGLIHPKEWNEQADDDAYGVHVEIFSEHNVFNDTHLRRGGWSVIEDDSDPNVICASKQAIAVVADQLPENDPARAVLKGLHWGGMEASDRTDVIQARADYEEDWGALRTLITRNTSYWAIDWAKVRANNEAWARAFAFDNAAEEAAQKYSWWQACKDQDVPLPEEPLVYHYHPVTFLKYVDQQLPEVEEKKAEATASPTQPVTAEAPECTEAQCPVDKALSLQQTYFGALEALKNTKKNNDKGVSLVDRLRIAEFARGVAERSAGEDLPPGKPKPHQHDRVWPSFRKTEAAHGILDDHPEQYEETYLKTYIKRIEQEIEAKSRAAEDAAEALIEHLESAKFQEHLETYHAHTQISPGEAENYYGAGELPPADVDTLIYSEKNHYTALLTDRLIATEAGKAFFERIIAPADAQNKGAGGVKIFKDTLGFTGHALSLKDKVGVDSPDPVGRFFYNVAMGAKSAIDERVAKILGRGGADSSTSGIRQAFDDPEVQKILSQLNEETQLKLTDWLETQSGTISERADVLIDTYQDSQNADEAVKTAFGDVCAPGSVPDGLDGTRYVPDRGPQITAALGIMAFGLTLVDISQKWSKLKVEDVLGFMADGSGLMEGYLAVVEGRAATQFGVAWLNGADDVAEAASSRVQIASKAGTAFAIVGGTVTAVMGAIKAWKEFQNENIDKALYELATASVGVASVVAAVAGATAASGILAVIGIVLIVIGYFLDIPIIDYLEQTYWGTSSEPDDPAIAIAETMDKYYEMMYSLDLRLDKTVRDWYEQDLGRDPKDTSIKIVSEALSDIEPIYVMVRGANQSRSESPHKRIYPGSSSYNGRGELVKEEFTWSGSKEIKKVFGKKTLRIKKFWEIWEVQCDDETEYHIEVILDPDHDGTSELYAEIGPVTFPEMDV